MKSQISPYSLNGYYQLSNNPTEICYDSYIDFKTPFLTGPDSARQQGTRCVRIAVRGETSTVCTVGNILHLREGLREPRFNKTMASDIVLNIGQLNL